MYDVVGDRLFDACLRWCLDEATNVVGHVDQTGKDDHVDDYRSPINLSARASQVAHLAWSYPVVAT